MFSIRLIGDERSYPRANLVSDGTYTSIETTKGAKAVRVSSTELYIEVKWH